MSIVTPASNLGRLESVDLRNAWPKEASDFTPWLAREENLSLLGKTIGIELELEAQEQSVGPFRADILCKDTRNGDWVLIENQLEWTDHTHLGQILTYAAGLKAVTIIWIADRFTEEHRATLDWLNDITDNRFNFFGIEVELWRIGDSSAAPKFNIVSQPNDWTRTIKEVTKGELTETKRLQLEFWTEHRKMLEDRGGPINPVKPLPQNSTWFAVGRTGFGLVAGMNTRKKRFSVSLVCYPPHHREHFQLLQASKDEIEAEIGEPLDPYEAEKSCWLAIERKDTDPLDRTSWPDQMRWLCDKLELFDKVFRERVANLEAEEHIPEMATLR